MKRREFITLLGGAAAAWPLAAHAQQPAMPVIGFLSSRSPVESKHLVDAFRAGLQTSGYVEGHNVVIHFRWAEGQYDRLPAMAAELVRENVAVLATLGGEPSALAAKAATSTIPIIFSVGGDPVKAGLVASLNRPGGNATGVSLLTFAPEAKRLGLLHEVVPNTEVIGALINPNYQGAEDQWREVQDAARAIDRRVERALAASEQELEPAFAARAEACRRIARHRRPLLRYKARSDRGAGGAIQAADDVSVPRLRRCRWTDEPPASIVITRFSPGFRRPTPGLTPGLAGRNRVGGTVGASATHWRAAHVNWFTRREWRKRYRHRHAQSCAPILSVGSGAHSRDHAVDRTGGSDLGAVPHRSNDLSRRGLCLRVAADIGLLAHHSNNINRRQNRVKTANKST